MFPNCSKPSDACQSPVHPAQGAAESRRGNSITNAGGASVRASRVGGIHSRSRLAGTLAPPTTDRFRTPAFTGGARFDNVPFVTRKMCRMKIFRLGSFALTLLLLLLA